MNLSTKIGLFFYLLITINHADASVIDLKGFIGKYPISMTLDIGELPKKDGAVIEGEYSYDKYKTPIKLQGYIDENYNYVLSEGGSKFKINGGWDCGGSTLSGEWTSDNGKALPVSMSLLREEIKSLSKGDEEYQVVIESSYGSVKKPLTFIKIGSHKLEVETDCGGRLWHHSAEKIEINNQAIYVIMWEAIFSGQGVVSEGKVAYIHGAGDKIDAGASGYRFGNDEFSKNICDISVVEDKLNRTCISETLLPDNGRITYKEKKEIKIYGISEKGFELKESRLYQRSDESDEDDSFNLVKAVESMDWKSMSH